MEERLALYRAAELLMKTFPGESVERVAKMLLLQSKQLILNAQMDQTQDIEKQERLHMIEGCIREIFS